MRKSAVFIVILSLLALSGGSEGSFSRMESGTREAAEEVVASCQACPYTSQTVVRKTRVQKTQLVDAARVLVTFSPVEQSFASLGVGKLFLRYRSLLI